MHLGSGVVGWHSLRILFRGVSRGLEPRNASGGVRGRSPDMGAGVGSGGSRPRPWEHIHIRDMESVKTVVVINQTRFILRHVVFLAPTCSISQDDKNTRSRKTTTDRECRRNPRPRVPTKSRRPWMAPSADAQSYMRRPAHHKPPPPPPPRALHRGQRRLPRVVLMSSSRQVGTQSHESPQVLEPSPTRSMGRYT